MNVPELPIIHLATDHAGLEHKELVKTWLQTEGYSVVDHGAHQLDVDDDFPDFITPAARAVQLAPARTKGIIFGGSGQGEAMCANRFPHVRATVYYGGPDDIVTLSRQHNDANMLSIGARFVDHDATKRLIWLWLHTEPLISDKYHRRNHKLSIPVV